MTGGANNLATFMQKVKFDRDKTDRKLESFQKKQDRLETEVCKNGGASEKMIEHLSKKAALLEKAV